MEIPNSIYLNKSADGNCVEVCLASSEQHVSLLNKNVQCDIRNIRQGLWRETLTLLHGTASLREAVAFVWVLNDMKGCQ